MAGHDPGTGADVPLDFETALSVDAVEEAARKLAGEGPSRADLEALCAGAPAIDIRGLRAGYGRMEILHGVDLVAGRGQSLCLIGPNGAGKSTVLHAVFGFADVMGGSIRIGERDVTRLASSRRLSDAGVAYVLQDNSVFPDMTVEENLLMGGYLLDRRGQAGGGARVRPLRQAGPAPPPQGRRALRRRAAAARDLPRAHHGAGRAAGGRALHRAGAPLHRHGVTHHRRDRLSTLRSTRLLDPPDNYLSTIGWEPRQERDRQP